MSEPIVKIVFEPPPKNAPGFLKRQKRALEFRKLLKQDVVAPETFDAMVEFLADYVTEPKGREKAVAALWEASEEQFDELMAALASTPKVEDDKSGESPLETKNSNET